MAKARKSKKEEKALSKEEILEEIKKLAERAKETTGQQLDLLPAEIGDEDIDMGFDASMLKDTANPEESYRLYYGIRRLLMDNLPKGKDNKTLRQKIYDEKNLFLNRGADINEKGIRKSDGRQTYIQPFLKDVFVAVTDWIVNGANSFDIFMKFRTMNEERGYYSIKPGTPPPAAEQEETPEPLV